MARLQDKVVLITGGGGGIGSATGRLCWEEGALVVLVDVDEVAATRAARDIDPGLQRVFPVGASIDDEQEAARAIAAAVDRWGRVDVLVNNAGVRLFGLLTEATKESWEQIIGVNLLGVAYCSKFAVPVMVANGGGTIVNVSSVYAVAGRAYMPQYDATKAGVLALTRALAHAHAEHLPRKGETVRR